MDRLNERAKFFLVAITLLILAASIIPVVKGELLIALIASVAIMTAG
jgi:hypothetical protein